MGGNQPLAKPFLNYPLELLSRLKRRTQPALLSCPALCPTPCSGRTSLRRGREEGRKPFPMLGRAARMGAQLRPTLSPPVSRSHLLSDHLATLPQARHELRDPGGLGPVPLVT